MYGACFCSLVLYGELVITNRNEFPMILVANKADLENERVVSYQEGEDLAAQMKVCCIFDACYTDNQVTYTLKLFVNVLH